MANEDQRERPDATAAAAEPTSEPRATPTIAQLAQIALVLESLPDPVAVVDPTCQILWVNKSFTDLFRLRFEAARGRPLSRIMGVDAKDPDGRALGELAQVGEGECELTASNRDGVRIPCKVRVRAFGDASVALRIATITDCGDVQRLRQELLRRAEKAVKERAILRATCEALEDAALVVDENERLVLANAAARRLFGLGGIGDAQGRALTNLPLPMALRGAWLAFLASTRVAAMQTARVELSGEQRTFLVRLARAWSAERVPLASMMVLRDLTKFTEPDRKKNDFIVQVSHELRTPLASIQGFVDTLLIEPHLEDDLRREFLEIIRQDAGRLARLIENLLEVARFDSGKLVLDRRMADLGALVHDVAAHLTDQAAAAQVPLDVALPEAPVHAWLDPERIQRAVEQLLTNALQHGANPRGVRLELREDVELAHIEVRDWGPGVSPEDLEKIFDPFYRVLREDQSGSTGGAGLGLAVCRQIIERHGGRILAELPEDGGLRFVVELPLR